MGPIVRFFSPATCIVTCRHSQWSYLRLTKPPTVTSAVNENLNGHFKGDENINGHLQGLRNPQPRPTRSSTVPNGQRNSQWLHAGHQYPSASSVSYKTKCSLVWSGEEERKVEIIHSRTPGTGVTVSGSHTLEQPWRFLPIHQSYRSRITRNGTQRHDIHENHILCQYRQNRRNKLAMTDEQQIEGMRAGKRKARYCIHIIMCVPHPKAVPIFLRKLRKTPVH